MRLCASGRLSVYCDTTVELKSISLAILAIFCLWEEKEDRNEVLKHNYDLR